MAQTPDPDGLMQQFYPLLGGRSNVVKESRQSSCLIFSIKDQSLADTAALAALPTVAACSLRGGRVRVELEAQTYEKAIKENTLMASKYDGLARIIIQNVGGKSNIISLTHCVKQSPNRHPQGHRRHRHRHPVGRAVHGGHRQPCAPGL